MNLFYLIISQVFNIGGFYLLLKYLRMMKNREFIQHSIEKGIVCYHCKEDIVDVHQDVRRYLSLLEQEGIHKDLCTICKRHESLNILLNSRNIKTIIGDILISKHFNIIYFSFLLMSIILDVINIFVKGHICGVIASMLLFFGQLSFYIKSIKITRPKKTQS